MQDPVTIQGSPPSLLSMMLHCAVAEKSATYLAVPISSGPRFVEWHAHDGAQIDDSSRYQQEHRRCVIQPNCDDAQMLAAHLGERLSGVIINPSLLDVPNWTQEDYRSFWADIIQRFAKKVVFADGWQFSNGCAFEFLTAIQCGADRFDQQLQRLDAVAGVRLIGDAIARMHDISVSTAFLEHVRADLEDFGMQTADGRIARRIPVEDSERQELKDAVLDRIAVEANVAQFVSFGPGHVPQQRFAHVRGFATNAPMGTVEDAVETLLKVVPERSLNVRSFAEKQSKGQEFLYGLTDASQICAEVRRLAADGFCTIVNETIDVDDGGVSGVVFGDAIEFAPGDTPRCVEKLGICSLPRDLGVKMLECVYGLRTELDFERQKRVEFSIHPLRRGVRNGHMIVWEIEGGDLAQGIRTVNWPNHFSRLIGDKAFGLLLAHLLGLPVPHTTVVSRLIAPFQFGRETTTRETWIRTCPREQQPGKYTTEKGWLDPFRLLAMEDGKPPFKLASVLVQKAVDAQYSGALISTDECTPVIEGVHGPGERFMLGQAAPEELPTGVEDAVRRLHRQAARQLGPVRMEWAFDGNIAWVLQLHKGRSMVSDTVIHAGQATSYRRFPVERGLDALREVIAEVRTSSREGIVLVGDVGITSHFGDLLRKSKIPSRIERAGE